MCMVVAWQAKRDIVRFCKLAYQRNLISSTDGNFSVRLSENRVLVTPSGIHKGFLTEEDLVVTDMEGKKVSGLEKPTSEINTHLYIYKARPDVHAIAHAHPPTCIAFTVAGLELEMEALPEVILALGRIPTAPYSTPSSTESGYAIENLIQNHDAIILSHHGSVTVGKTLFEAYNKLEKVEHAAEILWKAHQLGGVKKLSTAEVHKLISHGQKLGFLSERNARSVLDKRAL